MNNNPCDICTVGNPSRCLECVFGLSKPSVHCEEKRCMHYNCDYGCMLAFDEVCCASTCYVADEDDMEEDDETD